MPGTQRGLLFIAAFAGVAASSLFPGVAIAKERLFFEIDADQSIGILRPLSSFDPVEIVHVNGRFELIIERESYPGWNRDVAFLAPLEWNDSADGEDALPFPKYILRYDDSNAPTKSTFSGNDWPCAQFSFTQPRNGSCNGLGGLSSLDGSHWADQFSLTARRENYAAGRNDFDLYLRAERIESISGDFNLDGSTDAADYTIWRDEKYARRFDATDYSDWSQGYGSNSVHSTQAPEPTGVVLLLLAIAGYHLTGEAGSCRGYSTNGNS